VEHGQGADLGAEVTGITREFLDRRGGRAHEQAVEVRGGRAAQGTQLPGQGEGQEIGGAAEEEPSALALEPASGLLPVALGTMAVPASVVAIDPVGAAVALEDVSARRREVMSRGV
jgi:hypothetical protein